MTDLLIQTFVSPPMDTNAYLLADRDAARAVVIDPACVGDRLLEQCRRENWALEAVILTHGHIDHIHDAARLARTGEVAVLSSADAAEAMQSDVKSGAAWLGMDLEKCAATRLLAEGDRIEIGGCSLRVLHCPGHTPGCLCLQGDDFCFTGDVLFRDGVGRWDFPGGDREKLIASLRRLSEACPDSMRIYPGHGPSTTMGRERRENPFLLEWL